MNSAASPDFVESHQYLVRSLAVQIHRRLPPTVDIEDLVAYGQIGLAEAARHFDRQQGVSFATYAYYRIRGAIHDGLSKLDWNSHLERARRRFEQRANEIEAEEGAPPDAPAGESPGIGANARWLGQAAERLACVYLLSRRETDDRARFEEFVDPSAVSPADAAERVEIQRALHETLETLPPEASSLLRAAYFDGLSLEQAGALQGRSKSWASRTHADAIQRLGRALRRQGIQVPD